MIVRLFSDTIWTTLLLFFGSMLVFGFQPVSFISKLFFSPVGLIVLGFLVLTDLFIQRW